MKNLTVNLNNQEYYEDRISNCCGLSIFSGTDICVACENHTTYKITKMNIELKSESLYLLEDLLIGQLELCEQENDESTNDYRKQINNVLTEIQKQL
tara:strand:- start:955 stop:1245 length:291 start_codon:yes stop_codon:yes gene_type:complete